MSQQKPPTGIYEQLVSRDLARLLDIIRKQGLFSELESIDPADSYEVFAHHVYEVLRRTLSGLPSENRLERQLTICNQLLEQLKEGGSLVKEPPQRLLSIVEGATAPTGDVLPFIRPHVPLSASDLLVNARGEPRVGHALEREIPSSDRIDLICAFVRWNGLRLVLPQLKKHCEEGKTLRVITTTYTGSTERRALDELFRLGGQVKVSYETRSTRLHAKAWLFHRQTGFSTAYIGSSNLTQWAMLDGVEWNVRLSQVTSPDILEKFRATFDSYWEEPDFEGYDPNRDRERFDRAVSATYDADPLLLSAIDVLPYPHQKEILERLTVERERHKRFRNLIVAATGTGKTIVAALDYKRLRERLGNVSLLFVAHRRELLAQSLAAFRQVQRDGAFGELYVDGHRPDEWRQVFASIQSLSQLDLNNLNPDAFDVVIIDEFHHAAAATYRRLLDHVKPQILLGLTATPERADGQDILEWFGGRIAVELRLWEALERGLLCPFHYFGIHDGTDLSTIRWSRRGYDTAELENVYTSDHARVRLVAQAVSDKIVDVRRMRSLGFCVSIAHAEFMAAEFNRLGIPATAISAESSRDDRDSALRRLRNFEVNILFAVDLFNEGVDLPEIDTVLFLRPTESATIFLQQLGRGLRQSEKKSCLTVLDFVGTPSKQFRFDQRFRALLETTRPGVIQQVGDGFPYLPAGCKIQLDRVASDIILSNLKNSLGSTFRSLVGELRQLRRDVSLREFVTQAGIELEELYRSDGWTWTRLRRQAGLPTASPGPREEQISRAIPRLLHLDDGGRLAFLIGVLGQVHPPDLSALNTRQLRILGGLHFSMWGSASDFEDLDASLKELWAHPAVLSELREVFEVLQDDASHLTFPLGGDVWEPVPLSVHASYSLDEILTAVGEMDFEHPHRIREGTLFNEETQTDLFFVTLEKSEAHYSPTTLYKDYAISSELFHWESQSTTTQTSPTGSRYIRHRERGTHIMLFVRQTAKAGNRTRPYVFLGFADYVSHQGEKPIAFVWRLRKPMPFDFFRQAKVAAG